MQTAPLACLELAMNIYKTNTHNTQIIILQTHNTYIRSVISLQHLIFVRPHERDWRQRPVAPPARVDDDGSQPEAQDAQRLLPLRPRLRQPLGPTPHAAAPSANTQRPTCFRLQAQLAAQSL